MSDEITRCMQAITCCFDAGLPRACLVQLSRVITVICSEMARVLVQADVSHAPHGAYHFHIAFVCRFPPFLPSSLSSTTYSCRYLPGRYHTPIPLTSERVSADFNPFVSLPLHACVAPACARCLGIKNVDGLHQKSGSRNVVDLHGRMDKVRINSWT